MLTKWIVLVTVTLLFCIIGCGGGTVALKNSASVPAASGKMNLGKDDNNNIVIKLTVAHLASPAELTPSRNTYVVWVKTPEGETTNLGQLKVSVDLTGEFTGTTPLRQFSLQVTAEDISTVQWPVGEIVLSSDVVRP